MSNPVPLNHTHNDTIDEILQWLNQPVNSIFILKGAQNTGKYRVLKKILNQDRFPQHTIILAPDAEIGIYFKEKHGFQDVRSIYSWVYDEKPIEYNQKLEYPILTNRMDVKNTVIIILEASILSNSKFVQDNLQFGTGHIFCDLLNSIQSSQVENNAKGSDLFPKMLLVGDPYQIVRGSKKESLTNSLFLNKNNFLTRVFEISSSTEIEDERQAFQNILVGQIQTQRFSYLPAPDETSTKIKTTKEVSIFDLSEGFVQESRKQVYVAFSNNDVQKLNRQVRLQFLKQDSLSELVAGDFVELRNKTIDLDRSEDDWIDSGEIIYIIKNEGVVENEIVEIKDDHVIQVSIAKAKIRYSKGDGSIYYIPEFLESTYPQLTLGMELALNRLAEEISKEEYNNKVESSYGKDQTVPEDHRATLFRRNRFNNVAKLRYAYAITIRRAQSLRQHFEKIIVDGTVPRAQSNPATDEYFRYLYTATTLNTDFLQIENFQELTPFSKTVWEFKNATVQPILVKRRYVYDDNRFVSDTEVTEVFSSNPDLYSNELKSAFVSLKASVALAGWQIESVRHHNYLERYTFSNKEARVAVDFNYNKHYNFTIGNFKSLGKESISLENFYTILDSRVRLKDDHCKDGIDAFTSYINSKNWNVTDIEEHNYSASLVISHQAGMAKIILYLPESSVNKKGVISKVDLKVVSNKQVLNLFKRDFCHD